MQNKKRVSGKTSREHANPRVSRAHRKVSENAQVAEKKVSELITSSNRKQKSGASKQLLKKNGDPVAETNLNARCISLLEEDVSSACLGADAVNSATLDCKGFNLGTDDLMLETLFSPAFHSSKSVGGEIANGVEFNKFFHCGDQKFNHYSEIDAQTNSESICGEEKHFSGSAMAILSAMNSSTLEGDTKMSSKIIDVQSCGNQMLLSETNSLNTQFDVDLGATPEISAIYLAMKNSKLECVDEHCQDSMSTDVRVDEDDSEEYDDFDPYLFIKNLPALSSVVPAFRPMLLPKQTRSCPPISLVLDLDETLVHSTLEPCDDADFTFPVNFNLMKHTVYVKCRPHLKEFMERVASLFEIIVFTASQSIYAEQLLNILDPKRRVFRHRVFRESCVFVEGNYLKDLSVLGRDLARVAIVDNSPQVFGFQVDNGIPIESWFDDRSDQELLRLLPFLESLVGAEDVRPLIAGRFNLREKVGAAVHSTSRDSQER